MRHPIQVLITLLMLILSSYTYAQCGGSVPMLCDADGDRDVDQNDIQAISLAKGTPRTGPGDIRDMDGDGMITVLDARQCVSHCTSLKCTVPDDTPPQLTIDTPNDGAIVSAANVTVAGKVTDEGGVASVTVNGVAANVIGATYSLQILLAPGENTLNVIARDVSGNATSASIGVTYDDNQSSNQPPVAVALSSSAVLSFAKVTLDGSSSSDPDGTITLYNWIQIAGPQVDVQYYPFEPLAYFNAPSVASDTTLTFQLSVEDDKGASSIGEVSVEIIPAQSAQLQVELINLQFLKPSANQDSHADFFPVKGPPIASEQIKIVATLSGLIKDVAFEFRDLSDNVIGQAALTRLGKSANPPFDYGGDVTIPDQPFTFAAIGNTSDGQNFDVTFPEPVTPESFRVLFTPRLLELQPGDRLPIKLLIENGGPSETFNVEFSDLYGMLEGFHNTSLVINTGATRSIEFEIVAPQNTPPINPAPLRVNVYGQGNPTKKLTAELLLTVEDAP